MFDVTISQAKIKLNLMLMIIVMNMYLSVFQLYIMTTLFVTAVLRLVI